MRVTFIKVVAGDFDGAGFLEKAVVEANQLVEVGVDFFLDAHAHDLAQLGDGFGGPVIVAHQRFAGAHGQFAALGRGGAVAKGFGHGGLQVKHQPVFMAPGDGVQAGANQAQQGFVGGQLVALVFGNQAVFGQLLPVIAKTGGLGQPDHGLQITQATGGLFAVGLQRIGREVVFGVALAHFQQLAGQKGLRVHLRGKAGVELSVQSFAAGDATRFQQGGLRGQILGGFFQALGDGAHAGANFQPRIPATANELFDLGRQRRRRRLRQQHQHVNIGIGKQLTPAKTTDGEQAGAISIAGAELRQLPQRAQLVIRAMA